MQRMAHNLAISSDYIPSEERWMHTLTAVISDIDEEGKIQHSEAINMTVEPVMQPNYLVGGLRALADRIEEYASEKSGEENAMG